MGMASSFYLTLTKLIMRQTKGTAVSYIYTRKQTCKRSTDSNDLM